VLLGLLGVLLGFFLLGLLLLGFLGVLFVGGERSSRGLLVADVGLVEGVQAELYFHCRAGPGLLVLALADLDCARDVDLLELREVVGEETGHEEGLADLCAEGLEDDEVVPFQ
jgi:hypothetical protein